MTLEERAERLFLSAWAANPKNPARLRGDTLAALRAVRADALEEAAKAADEYYEGWDCHNEVAWYSEDISAAIRALATPGATQ